VNHSCQMDAQSDQPKKNEKGSNCSKHQNFTAREKERSSRVEPGHGLRQKPRACLCSPGKLAWRRNVAAGREACDAALPRFDRSLPPRSRTPASGAQPKAHSAQETC
jgi:hypothetical protein